MTLRELVQQAGGINSPAMDYEIQIWDIDLSIYLSMDPKIFIDKNNEQIKINVEG